MSDVLIAPYLPLRAPAVVGPWELVPMRDAVRSDGDDPIDRTWVREDHAFAVGRLVEAYRCSGLLASLGALAMPRGRQVGDEFDRAAMSLLRHALLAGVVASNPRMTAADEEQSPNAGYGVATAENAVLYGHPIGEGHSYVIQTGTLARTLSLRSAPGPGQPLPKVEPPPELPNASFTAFDDELADAVMSALSRDDRDARRLARALDWFHVALSNSQSVTLDVRVGAARAAIEALTGESETKPLVRAYGRLVLTDTTPTARRHDAFWAKGPVDLTEDEWWVTRLSELRNAIVHGDTVASSLWEHEGHHQLNHIHDRLIDLLRRVVAARAGDALLLTANLAERALARAGEELRRRLMEAPASAETSAGEPGTTRHTTLRRINAQE